MSPSLPIPVFVLHNKEGPNKMIVVAQSILQGLVLWMGLHSRHWCGGQQDLGVLLLFQCKSWLLWTVHMPYSWLSRLGIKVVYRKLEWSLDIPGWGGLLQNALLCRTLRELSKGVWQLNQDGMFKGKSCPLAAVMRVREQHSSSLPLREKKNQRQKSVTHCTEITYSTSTVCKKAVREGLWWIPWMWWSWKLISMRDWFLKIGIDTENHVWWSILHLPLSTREGCSVFTLLLKLLSVRKSRFICKMFNSKALAQIYGSIFQLLLL